MTSDIVRLRRLISELDSAAIERGFSEESLA